MTIKWVKVDPLVMNGEPFCYGSRITVRQLLEQRRGGAQEGVAARGVEAQVFRQAQVVERVTAPGR